MSSINTAKSKPLGLHGFRLGKKASHIISQTLAYIAIAIFLIVALMPTAWMVSTSLQGEDQIRIRVPIQWIPNPATLENYRAGWQYDRNWALYFRNSIFYAVGSSIGLVISCTLAGYAFARMRFPGREALMYINIGLMLLPGQVTMIPRFIMFARMNLVGTWWPVMIPFYLACAPYYVFLMRQFLRAIPMELSDAARIDGCNELGIFWRIIVPLTKPAIAVMVAGHVTWTWNNLLTALIYMKPINMRPIILGLQSFIGVRGQVGWGPLMAMSVLTAIPIVFVYFFLQRYFVQAFMLTGLKG